MTAIMNAEDPANSYANARSTHAHGNREPETKREDTRSAGQEQAVTEPNEGPSAKYPGDLETIHPHIIETNEGCHGFW